MSEQELIIRARAGDTVALSTLIESSRDLMFRYAYLIVCDAQLADDVVQEASLRIFRHITSFDENRAFRAWALAITKNLARNQNRAWGRYKHMIVNLFGVHQHIEQDGESYTEAQEQARNLHAAVRQLDVDHQDVIYVRFFLDLPLDECARILNIAEGTVKSRTHRALKQLKLNIERQFPQIIEDLSHDR